MASPRSKASRDLRRMAADGDLTAVLAAFQLGANPTTMVRVDSRKKSLCLLCVAAYEGHVHLVSHLLSVGLPVDGSGRSLITPLYWAARNGHNQVVKALLSSSPNIEATDYNGYTALHVAAQRGHGSCVDTLLHTCTDPNVQDDGGHTPLHRAALNSHLGVVKLLLHNDRCDPSSQSEEGQTPLHIAAFYNHLDVVQQLLLDVRCDPNTQDKDGLTPLHFAVLNNHPHIVEQLLAHDRCDPNIQDKDGLTSLHFAVLNGHLRVVQQLVCNDRCKPNTQDNDGLTPLHVAVIHNHVGVVQQLVNAAHCDHHAVDGEGNTALHMAIQCDCMEAWQCLVEAGLDPDAKNISGRTPMDETRMWGQDCVERWLSMLSGPGPAAETPRQQQMVTFLIELKMARQATEDLREAVECGNQGEVLDARAKGADLTTSAAVDSENKSVCLLSMAAHKGHPHLVSHLLAAGLHVDGTGESLTTPLFVAAEHGDIEVVKVLLSASANLEAKNYNDHTALHVAAQNGHDSCVEMLLHSGSDPNVKDCLGFTPLHHATYFKHLRVVQLLVNAPRCDRHAVNIELDTALHMAVRGEGVEVWQWLVEAGLDPDAKNMSGNLPMDEARKWDQDCVERWLSVLSGPGPAAETPGQQQMVTFLRKLAVTRNATQDLTEAVVNGDQKAVLAALDQGADPRTTARFDSEQKPVCLLSMAARMGHSHLVPSLLAAGLPVNGLGKSPNTPLICAVKYGNNEVVKALLSASANLEARDNDGNTALHVAAREGYTSCVETLLHAGSNPNVRNKVNITPLHFASFFNHLSIVQQLVNDVRCDRHAVDGEHKTALHRAVNGKGVEAWQCLMEAGLDPVAKSMSGDSPMDEARKWDQDCVERWLSALSGPGPTAETPGQQQMVMFLRKLAVNWKVTQDLLKAVESGDEEMMLAALKQGANPTSTQWYDNQGKFVCLLSVAAAKGHFHLVPHLLAAKLNVDGSGESPNTPLHTAVVFDHIQVVQALLTASPKPNLEAKDVKGRTALHLAAMKGNASCMEMLLDAGADPNSLGEESNTPLHSAAVKNCPSALRKLLRDRRCNRHKVTGYGNFTALHTAVCFGNMEAAQCLVVDGGLKPDSKDEDGFTPLDHANLNGYHNILWWLRKLLGHTPAAEESRMRLVTECWLRCEEYLLTPHSFRDIKDHLGYIIPPTMDVHGQDAAGRTPLHWAAKMGEAILARTLLEESEVYPQVVTWAGDTPRDLALREGHEEVVLILERHHPPQTQKSQEQLYKDLLSVISQSDDVQKACNLLRSGAPLEPVGELYIHPLSLAITNNRSRIVSLLVAAGAPLTTTTQGLNLLTLAWRSPDVTLLVQVTITRVFLLVLEHERRNMRCLPQLREGVDQLILTLKRRDDTAWRARWPPDQSVCSLTELMVQAARVKCTLTCSFLHQAGAQVSLCVQSGESPVQAALDAEHWSLAEQMFKYMGGCLYVPDSKGRLPTLMMPQDLRHQTEKKVYYKERNLLEDLMEKKKDKEDKEEIQAVLFLQEVLFTDYLNKMPKIKEERSVTTATGYLNKMPKVKGKRSVTTATGYLSKIPKVKGKRSVTTATGYLNKVPKVKGKRSVTTTTGYLNKIPKVKGKRSVTTATAYLNKMPKVKGKRSVTTATAYLNKMPKVKGKMSVTTATAYLNKMPRLKGKRRVTVARRLLMSTIGDHALLLASRSGLQQLIYLLVKVGGLSVDMVLDPTNDTSALHQAASYGNSGVIILLLSLGADPLRPDRYGHTPSHFAAMFGYKSTYQILTEIFPHEERTCRAGTTPEEVKGHFEAYLQMYYKYTSIPASDEQIVNDQVEATMNVLGHIDLSKLMNEAEKAVVDYSSGEAKEVSDAVKKELQTIIEGVSSIDEVYRGSLQLLGSTADGTRLYCPDEYDFNLLLERPSGVGIKVLKQNEEDALLSGHKLKIEIKIENEGLLDNGLMKKFYKRVRKCLERYMIKDKRMSIVPPGLTRTQVGVGLVFAWQGNKYPLLLVGIDLVPVLAVSLPEEINIPSLIPSNSEMMPISNTSDNSWRCSFAPMEVEVLKQLDPLKRKVYLTSKTLLSCMKAEPWMPRNLKTKFCWWDSRDWKIPIPAGFCLKNSFLRLLEKTQGVDWQEKDILTWVMEVFREMCQDMDDDQSTGVQRLVPAKVPAYFGGDCERPKYGVGAPEILTFLKKNQKKIREGDDSR